MNTEVNFELAKLLKEKGFDKPVLSRYNKNGDLYTNYAIGCSNETRFIEDEGYFILVPNTESIYLDTIDFNFWGVADYSAPTIVEVINWLYEKHGIWISVYEYKDPFVFRSNITKLKEFNSPTEAYEAAIEYYLINNISS